MRFVLPSPKRGFTTEFHCTACGHVFRRELRRIYVDGPTHDRRVIEKQNPRHSEYVIPQRIACPKCQAVDRYELTPYTYNSLNMAMMVAKIAGGLVDRHPVQIIAFALEDGRVMHPLDTLEEYRQKLTAAPQNAKLRLRYANTLRTLGYFDEAKAEYTTLVEQTPSALEAWYNLAAIHVAQKHKREAKKALLNLVKQALQSGKLSRAEAGWTDNAQRYLQGDWPLDELTPQGVFEAASIVKIPSSTRKRR